MTEKSLIVGQELYYVPREYRFSRPEFVTIQKVGRKWAETDRGMRISLEDLTVDGKGYGSPGTCYLTREEYEEEVLQNRLWSKLRHELTYNSPKVRSDKIKRAASLLGIDLDKPKEEV